MARAASTHEEPQDTYKEQRRQWLEQLQASSSLEDIYAAPWSDGEAVYEEELEE